VSLVDLIAKVNRNRKDGARSAFDLVHRVLKENYPQLRRVLPGQLPVAMQGLVDKGEMEAHVASSVQQLYELLVMPGWDKDPAGDTRGYAFLMLAEGAIHGILRSAQERNTDPDGDPPANSPAPIRSSWQGTYNLESPSQSFRIRLDITTWSGSLFDGTMTYPDKNGDMVTRITGTIEDDGADDGVRLTWKERQYISGDRSIVFDGDYSAIVSGDTMVGAWYQGSRRVAGFKMTASDKSATTMFRGSPSDTADDYTEGIAARSAAWCAKAERRERNG
jgi:hypothetical protein